MSTPSNKKRRGHPELDLAIRLRNWGWYWIIKNETGLSDDALDERFVSVDEFIRPRLFFRIRTRGSSPNELRGEHRYAISVFERVHKGGAFAQARRWFESALWLMLSEPGLPKDTFSSYVEAEIRKPERGWFRIDADDAPIAEVVLGIDDPALQQGLSADYSSMLHHLSEDTSANGLALVCALFREAFDAFELDIAAAYDPLLRVSAMKVWRTLRLPVAIGRILELLVQDRILRNVWFSEEHMPVHLRRGGSRVAEIKRFVAWYCEDSNPERKRTAAAFPIVLQCARTKWLNDHIAELRRLSEGILNREPVLVGYGETEPLEVTLNRRRREEQEAKERLDAFVAGKVPPAETPNSLPDGYACLTWLPPPRKID